MVGYSESDEYKQLMNNRVSIDFLLFRDVKKGS